MWQGTTSLREKQQSDRQCCVRWLWKRWPSQVIDILLQTLWQETRWHTILKITLEQIKRSWLVGPRSRGYASRDDMRVNGWSSLSEQIIFKERGAYQRAWVIGSLIMHTLRIFDHISNALELPAVPILQTTTHSLGITYVKSRPFMFPRVFNPEYFM